MNTKLKVDSVPDDLRSIDGANVKDILNINHEPHPFTIGPRHVTHASDKHGGMLGEATLRAIPCAAPGCLKAYDEHTCVTVALVEVTKDVTENTMRTWLKQLVDLNLEGLDGFTFLDGGGKIVKDDNG